jgi:hypothetical protein
MHKMTRHSLRGPQHCSSRLDEKGVTGLGSATLDCAVQVRGAECIH